MFAESGRCSSSVHQARDLLRVLQDERLDQGAVFGSDQASRRFAGLECFGWLSGTQATQAARSNGRNMSLFSLTPNKCELDEASSVMLEHRTAPCGVQIIFCNSRCLCITPRLCFFLALAGITQCAELRRSRKDLEWARRGWANEAVEPTAPAAAATTTTTTTPPPPPPSPTKLVGQ